MFRCLFRKGTAMPKKVLIVDDHLLVREGLAFLLKEACPGFCTEEAENGGEALKKIQRAHYDLVILDISMPGRDGLFVLKEIKKIRPRLPVIVLSVLAEELYGPRVLRAGASAYLSKCAEVETLVEAIQKVISGQRFISPSLAQTVVFDLGAAKEPPPHSRLTDEEFHVMRLIVDGKTGREIADEINLSQTPVAKMRRSIRDKLGLKTNAEIIGYAIRQGIVE